MYSNFYTSSEYYDVYDLNRDCIICWQPSRENMPVRSMKESAQFLCKCNAFFHNDCLNKWLDINHSCPICRKKICNENNDYLAINTIFFVNYCFYVTKMLWVFTSIHFIGFFIYNVIFFDYDFDAYREAAYREAAYREE